MRAGKGLSEGVRIVAASFCMDLSQPPLFLIKAIRLRVRLQNEAVRKDALTAMNVAAWSHGADMDYWDVVGHLYPDSFISGLKRVKAENQAIKEEEDLISRLKSIHVEADHD